MEYTIFICDDEQFFVDAFKTLIETMAQDENLKIRINTYTSGRKMITAMNRHIPDIILLDINMPDANGIDIAHTIREMSSSVIIIFISRHLEYVFQSFDVKAYSFIQKNDWGNKLPPILLKAVSEISKLENNFITLTHEYSVSKLEIHTIVYACLDKRHMNIVLNNNSRITISCTMNSLIQKLNSNNFILIYSGCLVNMEYITHIGKTSLILRNSIELPIARSRVSQIKQYFLEYISRKNNPPL